MSTVPEKNDIAAHEAVNKRVKAAKELAEWEKVAAIAAYV